MALQGYRSRGYERHRQLRREVGRMIEEQRGEEAVVQQASGPEQLMVSTFYRGVMPGELFRYWMQPDLLVQWWPPRAEIDPWEGGQYHLSWPAMKWDLRGTFTHYEQDSRLAFTWRWDHEPNTAMRHVDVRFEPIGDIGTQLTLTHSAYLERVKDQEERQGHLDGWTYFLARLHDALI